MGFVPVPTGITVRLFKQNISNQRHRECWRKLRGFLYYFLWIAVCSLVTYNIAVYVCLYVHYFVQRFELSVG